jgi:hypothetical protein
MPHLVALLITVYTMTPDFSIRKTDNKSEKYRKTGIRIGSFLWIFGALLQLGLEPARSPFGCPQSRLYRRIGVCESFVSGLGNQAEASHNVTT